MMRRFALAAGVLLLAALWLGPLPSLAARSFAAHMTLHMGVVAVAAPLIAAGLAVGGWRLAGPSPSVDLPPTVNRQPPTPLLAPIPLSVLELIIVWAWHAPALHQAARHEAGIMALEQASFLGAGVLVWLSSLRNRGPGIVALLLTSMHMTLLGALLALTPRPLYAHHGTAALADQHLGGAIMLLIGGASYLAGGLWLTMRLLQERGIAGGRA